MDTLVESAALVILLRSGRRPWREYAELTEEVGSAVAVLEQEQRSLFTDADLDATAKEITAWRERGIQLLTVVDPAYPENLRAVHDRPPLVFVAGRLTPGDARSVAVVGAREASPLGLKTAGEIAAHLAGDGYTVVSGLAKGIDAAAHEAAFRRNSRTIAVIGTGLNHVYPPQHAALQSRIATECAVVSQFWPDSPPARRNFPLRNAVMSGMTLATVVVEASHTSGARIQARRALAHGRPVFLLRNLLTHEWAREFARRPGTHVVSEPREISSALARLTAADLLVG